MGSYKKIITKSEKHNKILVRKSVHAKEDIQIGDKFTLKNIMLKRPGYGLPPGKLASLIGKKSKKKYLKESPIK